MIVLITSYLLALVASLAFIRYHIDLWKYPVCFYISLVLSVYLPVSVTILLPLDYVSHNLGPISELQLSDKSILMLWKGTYWSTFLLTWLILPILQEFYRVGNYLNMSKFKASLKLNAKFQTAIILCSFSCAIYLMLEVGLTFGNLKSMIIALSHIYALIMALWLMAHGMITTPRNLWIKGNLKQNLNYEYAKVPKIVDVIEETKSNFKDDILKVIALKENFAAPATSGEFRHRDWILHLYKMIPTELEDAVSRQYIYSESMSLERDQITEDYMSDLTYSFQTHFYKLQAHSAEYETVLERIVKLEHLIEAKCTPVWSDRRTILDQGESLLFLKMYYYTQCYIAPVLARCQSTILFVLSFIMLESEFFHSTRLSLVNFLAYKTTFAKSSSLQALCLSLLFMYMLFCSINSLARLKIFNMYHLVPKNSDPVSACFYGSYIARMTIPLSYNFVALFISRSSIFEEWYGQSIHLTGLFNSLNNWVPRLLLIPIVLTTFNVYDKLKRKLGLNSDYGWAEFDDTETTGTLLRLNEGYKNELVIVDAKRLVAMELHRRGIHSRSSKRAPDAVTREGGVNSGNAELFSDENHSRLVPNLETVNFADSRKLWTGVKNVFSRASNIFRLRRNSEEREINLHHNYESDEELIV